ncbi:MAG: hypothetical protein ABGX16_21465 [Pirellulales bacterium]
MAICCRNILLSFSLGLLGSSTALFLLQCVLIVGSMQTDALAQTFAQTEIAPTNQHRIREHQNLEYPGAKTQNALLGAVKQFEGAIQADPHHAANYVSLADVNIMLWCFGFVPRDDVLQQIKEAAAKATELDSQLAAAHTAVGIAKLAEWDWAGAEDELQWAVRLEPGRSQSNHWLALYLAAMGRHAEALQDRNGQSLWILHRELRLAWAQYFTFLVTGRG